jgi:hypothetical protein
MPCSELISTFVMAYKPHVNEIIRKYALAYALTAKVCRAERLPHGRP